MWRTSIVKIKISIKERSIVIGKRDTAAYCNLLYAIF